MTKKLDAKEVELFLLDNLDFFVTRESFYNDSYRAKMHIFTMQNN